MQNKAFLKHDPNNGASIIFGFGGYHVVIEILRDHDDKMRPFPHLIKGQIPLKEISGLREIEMTEDKKLEVFALAVAMDTLSHPMISLVWDNEITS